IIKDERLFFNNLSSFILILLLLPPEYPSPMALPRSYYVDRYIPFHHPDPTIKAIGSEYNWRNLDWSRQYYPCPLSSSLHSQFRKVHQSLSGATRQRNHSSPYGLSHRIPEASLRSDGDPNRVAES